ncbi:hypothetical protein QQF64_008776 [Cirrhinus molitorella]|uniref:Uncharacterized protein n=1 Tax=Cirrhinus molitorella TaxID=172907 RepID=A0ABR3MA73_9TELE
MKRFGSEVDLLMPKAVGVLQIQSVVKREVMGCVSPSKATLSYRQTPRWTTWSCGHWKYTDFIRKGIEKKKETRKRQDEEGDSKPKKETPGASGVHFRKEVV